MKSTRRDDRHYMSSVRVGPKGQIVIPKEAREMFGIEPGDTLILLGDVKRGLAIPPKGLFQQLAGHVFADAENAGETEETDE